MIYLTWRNITLSKTLGERSCSLQRHSDDFHDRERSIDRSGYGAFINENNPPSLAKGARRVLLVATSSGESMLSKGIATHSESVIQPACIESMLVRHPRGFSLRRSLHHVCHTRVRDHVHVYAHTDVYLPRASIFGVVRASYRREGICEPWYQTLKQRAGVSEAVLQAPQTTTSHLRIAPHYASASLASTNKGRIRDDRHPRMTRRVD